RLWESWGVRAEATLAWGHGDLAAAYLTGAASLEDIAARAAAAGPTARATGPVVLRRIDAEPEELDLETALTLLAHRGRSVLLELGGAPPAASAEASAVLSG